MIICCYSGRVTATGVADNPAHTRLGEPPWRPGEQSLRDEIYRDPGPGNREQGDTTTNWIVCLTVCFLSHLTQLINSKLFKA